MKIKQLICLLALTTPLTAYADFLSFSIGGGAWHTKPDGTFRKDGDPSNIDVDKELFWSKSTEGYIFAVFEHPVPALPNIKLAYTKISQSGEGDSDYEFDGEVYSGNVKNNFSVKSSDLIAYYEIFDNIISLDLGLNIRYVNADYHVRETATTLSSKDNFKQVVPMAYALIGASPYPGLRFSAEISYITYSGSDVSDMTAKVAYTTDYYVGFEAGYRKQNYNFDDVSNTHTNLSFEGAFGGAYVKF
jgi:outer membrane protein